MFTASVASSAIIENLKGFTSLICFNRLRSTVCPKREICSLIDWWHVYQFSFIQLCKALWPSLQVSKSYCKLSSISLWPLMAIPWRARNHKAFSCISSPSLWICWSCSDFILNWLATVGRSRAIYFTFASLWVWEASWDLNFSKAFSSFGNQHW